MKKFFESAENSETVLEAMKLEVAKLKRRLAFEWLKLRYPEAVLMEYDA